MRKTVKQILSLVAVATLFGSTLAMTACGGDYYKADKLSGYTESNTAATSNGGFAVEKDGYIYYINGREDYAASNEYGNVVKGSLMRIKQDDLTAGNYDAADVVVPMLFTAQDYTSGIYIYGDYVYYATPTIDKNVQGEVNNSWIDFKSAKLDGTETMKGYYFRLSNNAVKYRFVEENGVVYCLYEEDSMLKSYNTKDDVTTVLVKGGTYFYDQKDLTNGNVYYTMGVTYNADTDTSTTATYNQVYCVNAAATATVDKKAASYTVKDGRTYNFDEKWMEAQNDKAKKTAEANKTEYKATYDFADYSTYPYVNLGKLVLDGVGKNQDGVTVFNDEHNVTDRAELKGYTYTLSRYENGGIYYTKAGEQTDAKLYYLAESNGAENTVAANAKAEMVAWNTTNASSTALFEVSENGGVKTHTHLYIADSKINKVTTVNGEVSKPVVLCDAPSSATLWKTEKEGEDGVLYYYAAGTHPVTSASTSGYNLSKIVYTGEDKVYENLPSLSADSKYKAVTISYVDFNNSWYKPEMFGGVLMYANAEAIGSNSYNYIYATKLALTDIEKNNEAYEAAYEKMNELTQKDTVKKAMAYYYRTGDQKLIEDLYTAELYTKTEYEEVFKKFVAEQTPGNLISLVGKAENVIKADDKTAMEEGWKETLPSKTEEAVEESGLETWAICLIIVAAVVVVAVAIIVPVVILSKKKAEREEAEATVNAYKRPKIDTTDDKSIDVYADEEETPAEETAEEAPVEAVEEAPAEETTEE